MFGLGKSFRECEAIFRWGALSLEEDHMKFLSEGSTVYKYNYSNSKRMRRHFWIDAEKVELCWARSRTEEPQTMSLRDSKGLILGPMTTTFRRCENLEDPPWSCFSILFQ
ncbi:hypothetical protein AK812_SmicGene45204, partial [Symbiodinium microadriaticum]